MTQILLIGLGAGAASALLFASLASGSALAILLFYLARVPIMIAALGWSHWAALSAAALGTIGLTAIFGNLFVVAYAIGVAVPAWWLGYLALLARQGATPNSAEWYPVGRIVIWAAILGAVAVWAVVATFGFDETALRNGLRRSIEALMRGEAQHPEAKRIINILVYILPLGAAALTTLVNVVSLYLAGKVVNVSGRLRRPWPDLTAIDFPGFTPILFAASVAASMIGGIAGTIASILAASLFVAYVLLGLSVLHFVTRGLAGRPFILAGVYAITLFMSGFVLILVALLGLSDTALDIRGRVARKRTPGST
jgi:hypothetical protein